MHSSAASRTFLSEESNHVGQLHIFHALVDSGIDHVDDYCTGDHCSACVGTAYVLLILFLFLFELIVQLDRRNKWALRVAFFFYFGGSIALLGLLIQDYVGEIVEPMLLANYLMFELGPVFLSSLLVTPSTTAGCILGSHMLLNLRVMSGHKLLDEYGTESTSVDIPVPRRQPRTINSVGILDGATNPFPYPSHTATVRDAIDKVFERHDPNHIK
uniref:Uncharacterized protein n=1 Tax=Psilocybe cubensis TaxID=181762 RepID=A0A8H7XU22_PSICU